MNSEPAADRSRIVDILTLGRFDIQRDGQSILPVGKTQTRPLNLLKLLIAADGTIRISKAADALWPETDGDQAANLMKVNLNRLRKIVGKELLQQSAGVLSLNRDVCRVDIWELDRLIEAGKEQLDNGNTNSPILQQAFGLYRGEFLPDDGELAWVLNIQQQVRFKFLQVASSHVRTLIDNGQAELAISLSLDFLKTFEHEPLFYAHLIRAYEHLGYYNDARRLFWESKKIWNDMRPFLNKELIASLEHSSNG